MSDNVSPFVIPDGATTEGRTNNGGPQWIVTMPNGYGASVVCSAYSYGGDRGLWELAVLGPDGSIDYDTPITADVLGWLAPSDVSDLLAQIATLPASVVAP